ncbi:hypothetical protein L2Z40_18565 (plasmid) [Acinetobacter baumannii]|nr:hypothetical protein [Acinetobacter baumannii]UVU37032.1 hypothetical protein L2Z40_18565 [Acinetobacter baumannii]
MKNIPLIFALVLALSGCMSDEDFAFAKEEIVEKTINTYLQDQYSMIVISDIKNVTPSIYSTCSKYLNINKRMIKKQRVKLSTIVESEYVLDKDVNINDLQIMC